MPIDELPNEILMLIVANLRARDLKSLALTFNKSITESCLPLLRPLSAKRGNAKYISSRYKRLCHFDVVDLDSQKYHGSLEDAWLRWKDAWDPLEVDQELPRLKSFDLPSGSIHGPTRTPKSSSLLTIDQWQMLLAKGRSMGIEIPLSFWKAVSDPEIIAQMTSPDGSYVEVQEFVLMHSRITGGGLGFMLPFLHHRADYWSWYLYFEPGDEQRHCVLCVDNVLKSTDIDDQLMWELHRRNLTDHDRRMAQLYDVHHQMIDSTEVYLAGFCFRDWLAQRLFMGVRSHFMAAEAAEMETRDQRNSEYPTLLAPVNPQKRVGRLRQWFRALRH